MDMGTDTEEGVEEAQPLATEIVGERMQPSMSEN